MSAVKKRVSNVDTDHTEVLYVRISPVLKEIIEEEAASFGITLSQHIRSALLFDALTNGNPKAAKIAFSHTSDLFKSKLRSLFKAEQSGQLVAD